MFDTSHLHPMIVHFPIALLIVGFLSEVVGLFLKKEFFTKAAFYLLILGTLGVVAAYITGDIAGDGVSETGQLKNALETHEHAAQLTLWLMAGAAIVRIALVWMKKFEGVFKYAAFVLFLAGVLSVARTGYYGGELVYKHAAGVQVNSGANQGTIEQEKDDDKDDDED
ncbi:MAG: hypothetical protein M0Q21_03680 [Ignavibacteriaceae bacterium]|nr:hypothetical protein [Ignavibacteriaceae bacterium]